MIRSCRILKKFFDLFQKQMIIHLSTIFQILNSNGIDMILKLIKNVFK